MTPPTQPIDGTLLAAFQRFADLSCYWHRHGTPDSLAMSELQERHRLERDIPELIKRNTAFADLVSTRMFDAVAKVHAEPPRDDAGQGPENTGECPACGGLLGRTWRGLSCLACNWTAKNGASDTAGHIRADYEANAPERPVTAQETTSKEAWRMLNPGDIARQGDEYWSSIDECWKPSCNDGLPVPCTDAPDQRVRFYRRRVTPPPPAIEPPQP